MTQTPHHAHRILFYVNEEVWERLQSAIIHHSSNNPGELAKYALLHYLDTHPKSKT